MMSAMTIRLLLVALLALTSAAAARAQDKPPYARVAAGDLLLGYVAEGASVETQGHIGVVDGVVSFKPDPISAMWPMTVETDRLPAALAARVAHECAGDGLKLEGCTVTIRGTVLPRREGRRRIAADDIVIQAKVK
jgi:hypothetical protein